MIQPKGPKFKVGDPVSHRKDLYGLKESVVTSVERVFKEMYQTDENTFNERGLATLESDIKSISIPYEFDGDVLKVHCPASKFQGAHTRVSKFYGYAYVTKNEKMNTIWPEKALKHKKA